MKINELIRKLENSTGNLLILVGPPLSGKSTFCKKIENFVTRVSRDDILMELSDTDDYQVAFKTVNQKDVTDALKKKLVEVGQDLSENVAIDMTNITPKGRRVHLAKFPKFKKYAVTFEILSDDEFERRNQKRLNEENKYISPSVIEDMISRYKYPTVEEGFDKIVKS